MPDRSDSLGRKIAPRTRRRGKLPPASMNSAEFRRHRLRLGLTQTQLAFVLDVSDRAVRHWEFDRQPDSIAVRVVGWLLAGWYPPDWPADFPRITKDQAK